MSRACRIAINVVLYPCVTRPCFSEGWMAMMEKPATIKIRETTTIISISEKPRILRENMNPFFLRGGPAAFVARYAGRKALPLWERPLANPHANSSYGGDGRASKY